MRGGWGCVELTEKPTPNPSQEGNNLITILKMKKLILLLILFLTLGCSADNIRASTSADFSLTDAPYSPTEPWKRLQFDKLALDAVIPSNNGEEDSLNALAIMNMGSAYYRKGIEKLVLWTDNKTTGFQGMGVDNEIGEAVWDSESFTWYWKDLDLTIPEEGLRIFISVEVENNLDDSRIVQLAIPKLMDNNSNEEFDAGDKGVFVSSKNNGPVDDEVKNISVQSIRYGTSDKEGPKSVMTNLFNGDEITLGDEITIAGLSKDQGRLSPKSVQISIVKDDQVDEWKDVSTDKLDFADWEYVWNFSETGSYNIKLKSRDLVENESITDAIIITVIEKEEKEEEEEEDEEEEEELEEEEPEKPEEDKEIIIEINDGDLVRAAGDYKVYVVKGNYRRWVQSSEIFNFYGHFNFSVVKEISGSQLENYTESWLIRADGDKKVYEINADGAKHWLNITAEEFTASGRNWDMVYVVNNQERDFYATGADIVK